LSIVNSHAPIKTKRVRSGKVPWITSDLRKGMRDRDVAKRKAISLTILKTGLCGEGGGGGGGGRGSWHQIPSDTQNCLSSPAILSFQGHINSPNSPSQEKPPWRTDILRNRSIGCPCSKYSNLYLQKTHFNFAVETTYRPMELLWEQR